MIKIKYSNLKIFTSSVLEKAGLDKFSCECVTTGLCETSLRGVDSHGIRLLHHYVRSAELGRKNPQPKFKFYKTFPSFGYLDADDGFGHAAGMHAIDIAMKIANDQGVGAVSVINSSHPGAMASMTLRAAREGYMSFGFTHADSLVKSHNSRNAYFGTNPICFAVPRYEMTPYCLDMSCSKIAWNKLLMKRSNNETLETGLAANESGSLTIEPTDAKSLIPIGDYKGYGLASMVEILCGIYGGMPYGKSIPPMFTTSMDKTRKLGQFYIVLRTDAVIKSDEFLKRMSGMSNEIYNQETLADENVILPGDKEDIESKKRLNEGIPIDNEVMKVLNQLSDEYNIELNYE